MKLACLIYILRLRLIDILRELPYKIHEFFPILIVILVVIICHKECVFLIK
jgi:hypothetical protein